MAQLKSLPINTDELDAVQLGRLRVQLESGIESKEKYRQEAIQKRDAAQKSLDFILSEKGKMQMDLNIVLHKLTTSEG